MCALPRERARPARAFPREGHANGGTAFTYASRMSSSTWIVVTHPAGARVYESTERGGTRLVRDLAGSTVPAEHGAPCWSGDGRFAREVAWLLGRARTGLFFQRLVLVGAPDARKTIRGALDAPTRALVASEHDELDAPKALAG
jgi:hypothetical protein